MKGGLLLAQTPLALARDGILLDRLGKRNVLSIRTFSCPYLFFTDHWLLCDLAVNLAFAVLLAANTNFDLLGLGLSLLGEIDLQHALVVVGAYLPRIHGVGQRERAGETSILPLDATVVLFFFFLLKLSLAVDD